MNRLVAEAVGGSKLTGSAILYSGLPVTINGPDTTTVYDRAKRADGYRKLVVRNQTVDRWFGTDPSASPCTVSGVDNSVCAYGAAAPEQVGTASVGSERAPGFRQIDLTAGKQFHITESQNVECWADGFKVFNIPSYSNPEKGITDSHFGQITDLRSQQRQIQFSLHYNF